MPVSIEVFHDPTGWWSMLVSLSPREEVVILPNLGLDGVPD
jgi:hypothetical protein